VSLDAARGGVVEGGYRVRPLFCCAPCTEHPITSGTFAIYSVTRR
jgi:hypothetical protein